MNRRSSRPKSRGSFLFPLVLLAIAGSSIPSQSSTQKTSATGRVAEDLVPEPIAVMPFRNINENEDLDWLSVGMSETMLSDLRREGKRVVMRDALDTAIAEMALQGIRPTDESTAAQVGRLVGAKTMVFGGYQTAAGQIRITARFVEVETSLVLDAAMATGPMTNVLSLQDEIVTKILGRPPAPPTPVATTRPRTPRAPQASAAKAASETTPPTPPSTDAAARQPATTDAATPAETPSSAEREYGEHVLEAYRFYSMSLTTASDADRIALLQRSIELDEGFVYAIDELRALERRLRDYRQQRLDALEQRTTRGLEAVLDESLPSAQRSTLAIQVMADHMTAGRYRTLSEVAAQVYDLNLPSEHMMSSREMASYYQFKALELLGNTSTALQVAERHLQEFPAGTYAFAIQTSAQVLIQQEERKRRQRAEAERELEQLPARERELEAVANAESRKIQRWRLGMDRCRLLRAAGRLEEAHEACSRFLEEETDALDSYGQSVVLHKLRLFEAERRFDEGRAWADELLAGDPSDDIRNVIRDVVTWWPAE